MIHFQRLILFKILNSVTIQGHYRSTIVTKFSPEKLENVSKNLFKKFWKIKIAVNFKLICGNYISN